MGRFSSAVLRVLSQRPLPTACFLAGWPALFLAAVQGLPLLFTVAVAVLYLSDLRLSLHSGLLDRTLREVRFPLTVRFVLRQLLLVLLLVRAGAGGALPALALASFVLYYVLQVPQSMLLRGIRRSRRMPMASRNIDLTELGLTGTPPPALTRHAFEKAMHTDTLAATGLLLSLATGSVWPGILGCAAMLALCLGYTVLLTAVRLRAGPTPRKEQVFAHVDAWLRAYRPSVVLYFSGTRGSAYQVNMWLDVLARTGVRPLVLLRERHILDRLDPTPLPVLCIPAATDVMDRDLSSVRVVLYPANVGPNIHMLRMPGARHVFVGHGDSDKTASINPYAKVYDEVWTAGRAGRDRWAGAGVGVRDDAVVEVGRPQLGPVQRGPRAAEGTPFTVLYAPTWEGWTSEKGNTSLIAAGEAIVETLLSLPRPVRILYKPHPYTGIRDPEAKEAHRRIVAALEDANAAYPYAGRDGENDLPEPGTEDRGESVETTAERLRAVTGERELVKREITALGTTVRPGADDIERSRDSRFAPEDAARRKELLTAEDTLYWRSTEPWRHHHITGPGPHLYSCFNACDLLISDVSSVVSDFMATEKPYAVTDVEQLGGEEFRRLNPTARAAYLLSPDARELAPLVERLTTPGGDSLAGERAELRDYLLGPGPAESAAERFRDALVKHLPAAAVDPPESTTAGTGVSGGHPASGVPGASGRGVRDHGDGPDEKGMEPAPTR